MISQLLRKKYPKNYFFLKINHISNKDIKNNTTSLKNILPKNKVDSQNSWKHIHNSNLLFINIPDNTYIH